MTTENLEDTNIEVKTETKKRKIFETLETVFIALILAVFIRATVAEARYIPSESMVPTLLIHDRLVVEKISNYTGGLSRGEVLVFYPPEEKFPTPGKKLKDDITSKSLRWLGFTSNVAYIKRLIGLPGETVEVKDGLVYINGKPLDEDYIKEKPAYEYGPITLKNDELFMMGDNRNNSQDSHAWGTLPVKNIIGHAIVRFWPPQRMGLIK